MRRNGSNMLSNLFFILFFFGGKEGENVIALREMIVERMPK